jgi:cytochrome c-type biogenesis protein CcmH
VRVGLLDRTKQVCMSAVFWFVSGVLTGVAAAFVALPLWRASASATASRSRRVVALAAGILGMVAVAAAIYLAVGSPQSVSEVRATRPPAAHPSATSSSSSVLSMQAATARLEARLRESGGSAEDWQLLAQSYEFLGRTEDAKRARSGELSPSTPQADALGGITLEAAQAILPHAEPASAGTGQDIPAAAPPLQDLERRVKSSPGDSDAWLELADAHRRRHEFVAARSAFQKVMGLHAMTAQSWADYADVLGSASGGTLNAEAGKAIDQSLALDPVNEKALWLQASRALQQRQYTEALQIWRRLKSVLPAGSPDSALVEANIAEAAQLAGADTASASLSPSAIEVTGTVSVDERFVGRIAPDAVLFIYAKAADSPGPPLAVVRLRTRTWPVAFRLDDTMAMMPSRRLSQFQKVIVEARVSRTGQATPEPGDLYVTSEAIRPTPGKKLALVINREIG